MLLGNSVSLRAESTPLWVLWLLWCSWENASIRHKWHSDIEFYSHSSLHNRRVLSLKKGGPMSVLGRACKEPNLSMARVPYSMSDLLHLPAHLCVITYEWNIVDCDVHVNHQWNHLIYQNFSCYYMHKARNCRVISVTNFIFSSDVVNQPRYKTVHLIP